MKFNANFAIFCYAVVLCAICTESVDGKRLRFRPLSSKEVYRVLREYGREDLVPEGRHISQGIAAVTGFTLGLTKGIGGSILYDILISNATVDYLNSLNFTAMIPVNTYSINIPSINYTAVSESLPTINVTALTNSIPTINVTALTNSLPTINVTALTNSIPTINVTALANSIPTINTTAFWSLFGNKNVVTATPVATTTPTTTTQEICFTSRSLDEIAAERAYDGQDNDDGYEEDDVLARQAQTPTTGTSPITTATGTGPGNAPSTTPTTSTSTVTSTPSSNPITCVVLQKPAVRSL